MSTVNNFRRGWALRHLREAKVGLAAAQETPSMPPSLVWDAMKKAQAAIYYSLGDPAFIEPIVQQTLNRRQVVEDPILRFLVEIERMVQRTAHMPTPDRKRTIQQADNLIQIASDIVELFTGEKAN